MPIDIQPLENAPVNYDRENEDRFRAQVERYLIRLSSGVSDASAVTGKEASLASKRENFVSFPVG